MFGSLVILILAITFKNSARKKKRGCLTSLIYTHILIASIYLHRIRSIDRIVQINTHNQESLCVYIQSTEETGLQLPIGGTDPKVREWLEHYSGYLVQRMRSYHQDVQGFLGLDEHRVPSPITRRTLFSALSTINSLFSLGLKCKDCGGVPSKELATSCYALVTKVRQGGG